MTHSPQPDVEAVEAIASLYASGADSEAHALYEEVTVVMSARGRLKFSHAVEEEIRRIQRHTRAQTEMTNVESPESTKPQTLRSIRTIRALRFVGKVLSFLIYVILAPVRGIGWLFEEGIVALIAAATYVVEVGVVLLYVGFWIALGIVVFYEACRIIG